MGLRPTSGDSQVCGGGVGTERTADGHSGAPCFSLKAPAFPFRFKERVLQTPNDLLVAGFEEHTFRNFFNAVS